MKKLLIALLAICGVVLILATSDLSNIVNNPQESENTTQTKQQPSRDIDDNTLDSDEKTEGIPVTLAPLAPAKTLQGITHTFQTFNNCGPASLAMTLSYFGSNISQQELGRQLRPYQNPLGDNDDKSVTLEELAQKAKEQGYVAFHRPAGSVEVMQHILNADTPVITRTWLKPDDDIGHYRVVKGYDLAAGTLVQDDSLQGKDLIYSNAEFETIWGKFNYEFLVVTTQEKASEIESILQHFELLDVTQSWQKAHTLAEQAFSSRPTDPQAGLNLSVALFHLGQYEQAVKIFEGIQPKLPNRALWYQIEPIEAYFQLGDYDKVLDLTDTILSNGNRAFSELYVLRSKVYQARNEPELADAEFEKAVLYNYNFRSKLPNN